MEVPTLDALQALARQVSVLNERLAALEARLATEVRTARLVIVDDHGRERISTTTTHAATLLEINGPGSIDRGTEHASVHLEATANGSSWSGHGDEIARAAITLHSADDTFTSIEQVALTNRHVAQTIHEPTCDGAPT